jgi:hypothetical protein
MKRKYTLHEKIKYVKWKCDNESTPLSEKIDIIDFLIDHSGLFGTKLNPEKFINELNKLTADISHEPNKE